MKSRKVLMPEYMNNFKCIGSACEDTCCVGWGVSIDETTYRKYKNSRDAKYKKLFGANIKRVRKGSTPFNYAMMNLDKDRKCSFLNEENLCSIQLDLGEDFLSQTCTNYPRNYNLINQKLEKSATMSCPEATRLALLNPKGISFQEVEESYEKKVSNLLKIKDYINSDKAEEYFEEIRTFSIQLMKTRDYDLTDRLLILGLFINEIQEAMDNNKEDTISNIVASYTNLIIEGAFKSISDEFELSTAIQFELLFRLIDLRIFNGVGSKRYLECYKDFLEGIEFNNELNKEQIIEKYNQAFYSYYKPFVEKHEYIIENYIVNYIFGFLFPFGRNKKPIENYILLIVHYALIKMHLIGMSAFYKEGFNADHVIKLIQSFAKAIEHNTTFFNMIHEVLNKANFNNVHLMAILIKND